MYPAYSGVDGNPPGRSDKRRRLVLPLVVVIVLAGAGLWWGVRSLSTHWAERSARRHRRARGHLRVGTRSASRFGVGYDVPAEWAVKKCGVVVGWEQACAGGPFERWTIQTMDAVAELEAPGCPDAIRTVTGLDGATDTSNLRHAARSKALLVRRIYTSDDGHIPVVSLSDPKNVTVGGLPAVQIVANVTDVKPDECTGSGAIHAIVAIAAPGATPRRPTRRWSIASSLLCARTEHHTAGPRRSSASLMT